MYFAHHAGKHIRLAVADDPEGPWRVLDKKILPIKSLKTHGFSDHVASPDVHVDHAAKRIRLYFHAPSHWPKAKLEGRLRTKFKQNSGAAESRDGLLFTCTGDVPLSLSYLRLFQHDNVTYGLAARALLYKSDVQGWPSGDRSLNERKTPLGSWRHCAVHLDGNTLYVFYTRWGDAPERIVVSTVDLSNDWEKWRLSPAVAVLQPEGRLEGAHLKARPSKKGAANKPVNELRDPYFFKDGANEYLFYSHAGEQGISVAVLAKNWKEQVEKAIKSGAIDRPDSAK